MKLAECSDYMHVPASLCLKHVTAKAWTEKV